MDGPMKKSVSPSAVGEAHPYQFIAEALQDLSSTLIRLQQGGSDAVQVADEGREVVHLDNASTPQGVEQRDQKDSNGCRGGVAGDPARFFS
jgi:hypothetical protein